MFGLRFMKDTRLPAGHWLRCPDAPGDQSDLIEDDLMW